MLPFSTEANIVKSVIREQNRQITFQKMVARRRNFDKMIVQNPRILHLCVHSRSEKENKKLNEKQKWVLLFEKDEGEGDPIEIKQINKLFNCQG